MIPNVSPLPPHTAHPQLVLDAPVTVEVVEEALPGGPRNRMTLTVWVEDQPARDAPQSSAARALAIGFLERTLEAMRNMPAASFTAAARRRPSAP